MSFRGSGSSNSNPAVMPCRKSSRRHCSLRFGTLKRRFAFLEFLIIHVEQKLDVAYLKTLFTRIRHNQAQFLVQFVRSARLEIDQGDPRVGTESDVSESDVPMDDASFMQLSESINDAVLQTTGIEAEASIQKTG
jgi:hypothetical protein